MRLSFVMLALGVFTACDAADPITTGDADSAADTTPDTTADTTADTTPDGNVLPTERTVAFTQVGAAQAGYTDLFSEGVYLYAQAGTELVRSNDGGRTWASLGVLPGDRGLASDGAGRFYRLAASDLFVSEDGAATWQRFDDPFDIQPNQNQVVLAASAVNADAWWLATDVIAVANMEDKVELARSLDHGVTFEIVATPQGVVDRPSLRIGPDGDVYLLGSQQLHRTSLTGPIDWERVDPGGIVNGLWISSAGTLFVQTYSDNRTRYVRKAADSAEWVDLGAENRGFTFLQNGADILRIDNYLAVDVSHDDGVTWEARAPRYEGVTVGFWSWATLGDELVGADASGFLRLAADATAWAFEDGGNLPPLGYANFRDIAFSTGGRIAVLGEKQVFVSDDDGRTWRRSAQFDTRFTAIAIKPDGSRIVAGSTLGRFWLFNGDDLSLIAERNLGLSKDTIRQATWVANGTESIFLVATANDEDTDGMLLYSAGLDDDGNNLFEINPSRLESDPQARFTQGYHAVAMHGPWLHVLFRRWGGTNSWQPYYRVNYDFFGNDSWLDDEVAVAFTAPRSITLTHTERPTPIIVYGNNDMYFGSQKLIAVGVFQPPSSAKLDYRERLWVIAGNVYRSNAPLEP